MLMRGDLNKIIAEFNGVLEGAFDRIKALEDKVMSLEAKTPEEAPKKPRGRPKKEDPKEF